MNSNKSRNIKGKYSFKQRNSWGSKSPAKRHKRQTTSIDPKQLVSPAVMVKEKAFTPSWCYNETTIDLKLKSNLRSKGYIHPTKIQQETLDYLLQGRDMVGVADTGTGKTGAFLIPIINQLLQGKIRRSTLIVVPTRELALQIESEFKSLTHGMSLYVATFIGGTSVDRDLKKLRKYNHVIIGTPGRLLDLAQRGSLRLGQVSNLVLDEFDRMLDMGFLNDIKKILKAMEVRTQTMLFSATIDPKQRPLIDSILTNAIEIKIGAGNAASNNVEQDIIRVAHGEDKFNLLMDLIGNHEFEKVLIFAETKRLVDRVSKRLIKTGVNAEQIHGNKSQNYRIKAINKFKNGQVQVLVATDVAARGIDVTDVTHVINYQIPLSMESYIHRIGRTGRAGKTGKAFTFVDAA